MRFVCDAAGGKTWFRIETEAEAAQESELMRHAVEKLTLRDVDGTPLATAVLPPLQPVGRDTLAVCPMVVGPGNGDPYAEHGDAIRTLGRHFGVALDRSRCYPYGRL